jgi:putative tryptophan/tyrosine transport system ATP-binding protein
MLKINKIHKTFTSENGLENNHVLKGISLTLNDGDFLTVIGGNGSGKTTLLNCICGVQKPDSGTISIDGLDITKLPEYKRAKLIGRVFQDPMQGTIPEMTIIENLSLALNRGKSAGFGWSMTKNKREFFEEQVKAFDLGLENRLDDRMKSLSGGQRQSLTLLMATFNSPKLLLLDEHTAALDPKTARKVMEKTDEIVQRTKIPTIMITHNMKDAINYGNKLIMMKDGKIIFECEGKEKADLTVDKLIKKFNEEITELPDSMIL